MTISTKIILFKKGEKIMKKLLSIILCLSIILSICCYSVSATVDFSYKIDDALAEKLEAMDDDDTIDVSIWFKDIDYDIVKEKTAKKVKDIVSDDVLTLVKNDGDENVARDIFNREKNKSQKKREKESKQMQIAIKAKREIAYKMQEESNREFIEEMFPSDTIQPTVLYESKFAPNIEVSLTKEQINEIITSPKVEELYCASGDLVLVDEDDRINVLESEENTSAEISYDDSYFDVTKINHNKTVYHLYGNDAVVGIYDGGFTTPDYVDYFANNNVSGYWINSSNISTNVGAHGNLVACLIGGQQYDDNGDSVYSGGVPQATMYWTAGYGYKASFEYLINNGCNVINMSRAIVDYNDESTLNKYADYDKWLDHISVQHNVHLVFSAGNKNSQGVSSGKTTNNAIVVGACDNSGNWASFSSYSTVGDLPYKPDLVAPGVSINWPGGTSSGTSCSAPITTAAVAQFCALSSPLRANPTLMKALLLSGTTRTSEMIENSVESTPNQTSVAFSQKYGCGMLNAYNLYTSAVNNYYTTGTLSSTDIVVNLTKRITGTGKHLRVVATWDRVSEITTTDHTTGTVDNSVNDVFLLSVTAPDGTVYDTIYYYDTKALISFDLPANGTYAIKLTRIVNSGESIDYGIAYSVMSEA